MMNYRVQNNPIHTYNSIMYSRRYPNMDIKVQGSVKLRASLVVVSGLHEDALICLQRSRQRRRTVYHFDLNMKDKCRSDSPVSISIKLTSTT
jgi:hypothetical protein